MTTGKRPRKRSYASAEFVENSFANARFRNVNLAGAKIRGAFMTDVDIDGIITGLVVNGVEVEPLILAEKLRRQPELALLEFSDAAGARDAWTLIENTWTATMELALGLPVDLLETRVDGEWSFPETLRHLVFATDAWIGRTILRAPVFAAAGLPATDMPPWLVSACGLDIAAAPTLAEIVELRRSRLELVRGVVDELTDDTFGLRCKVNRSPGYPTDPRKYTVGHCLQVVVHEEWAHHEFAVRDLKTLAPDLFIPLA